MIYTCTLNPAIDYLLTMRTLESNQLNRVEDALFRAGGKGINVSVVLNNLNVESTATGFIGGFSGQFIKDDLEKYELITQDFIEIQGTTRINVKLSHSFKETEINPNGPAISNKDMHQLLAKIETLTENDLLICSGSTANGQPDAYQMIAEVCAKKHIPFVLDIPEEKMIDLLRYHPLLIKPNLDELEAYFDVKIQSMDEMISYGRQLNELGAEHVMISMGSKGSLYVNDHLVYRASLVHGHAINTTGAGDSMVAGFIQSYLLDRDPKKAYLNAAICGSATVFGEGLANQDALKLYKHKIKIKEINS